MSESLKPEWLAKELDRKRQELARCHRILEDMIVAYDKTAESAVKNEHSLGVQSDDIQYLWGEIRKLQEGLKLQEAEKLRAEERVKALMSLTNELRQAAVGAGVNPDQLPALTEHRQPERIEQPAQPETTRKRAKVEKQFYCGLDTPRSGLRFDADEMIHLGGWCIDGKGMPASRIWIAVGNREIPCTMGWKRVDVVKAFSGQLTVAANCGFNVEIEGASGANFIRVWAEFQNGASHCILQRTIVKVEDPHYSIGQLDQNYREWVELFDTPSLAEFEQMHKSIHSMGKPPLISVLLPTYNTDERWLSEAIESVRKQVYPHWQLCIADDASPKPHVRQILEHYSELDSRIVHVIRKDNGHISAATNTALELAEGEFCALLDHDDVLPRHALYHIAKLISEDPEVDLIYSDEDKIDEKGERFDPYFKSGWNPELFQSHNCVSHLGVYRTSVLREIGGFQEDLFGSQDWDLAFRFISKAGEKGIRHIPKILYHWRYLDSSTSKSIESKPYAVTAGKRAIQNYLTAKNQPAIVENGGWPGSFRVKPLLDQATTVSVIVLQHNLETAESCIRSILNKTEYSLYEIVLVTEAPEESILPASQDTFRRGSVRRVGGLDKESVARSFNRGALAASGEVLVFLSEDVSITSENWLSELTAQVQKPDIGVAGAWQQFPDATTQCAGLVVKDGCSGILQAFRGLPETDIGHMGRAHLIQRYSAIAKECFVTKRSVFQNLNGFAENEFPNLLWNVDYCFRSRLDAGKFSVWSPHAKVCVHERYTDCDSVSKPEEFRRFKEHWGAIMSVDPYFNPNLDQHDPRFFLRWPPAI